MRRGNGLACRAFAPPTGNLSFRRAARNNIGRSISRCIGRVLRSVLYGWAGAAWRSKQHGRRVPNQTRREVSSKAFSKSPLEEVVRFRGPRPLRRWRHRLPPSFSCTLLECIGVKPHPSHTPVLGPIDMTTKQALLSLSLKPWGARVMVPVLLGQISLCADDPKPGSADCGVRLSNSRPSTNRAKFAKLMLTSRNDKINSLLVIL